MEDLIGELIECVDRRIRQDEEVSVGAVSKELGFTRQYVSGRFHKITGHLLSRYLKERRLEKAARLLKEKKLKISQISRLCGFDSENYFRQQFRMRFAMSPRQFRSRGELKAVEETPFPELTSYRLKIRR